MRVQKNRGRRGLGSAPLLDQKYKDPCPKCRAVVGERCRGFRRVSGVESYVTGYLKRRHRERLEHREEGTTKDYPASRSDETAEPETATGHADSETERP